MMIVEWKDAHRPRLIAIRPSNATTIEAGRNAPDASRRWLAGLLMFNGVGAIGGGIGLLIEKIGMPLSLLEGTPFESYTIPGWILLTVVGGSSTVASILVWRQHRHGARAAIVAGAILLGWIVTEFVMIPDAWAPQLLYAVISVAILVLGTRMDRQRADC